MEKEKSDLGISVREKYNEWRQWERMKEREKEIERSRESWKSVLKLKSEEMLK